MPTTKCKDDATAKDEILGVLGPNGAETTMPRMIAGYTTPTSGRITVSDPATATHPTDTARAIGYVPERPPLYETLDVGSSSHIRRLGSRVSS